MWPSRYEAVMIAFAKHSDSVDSAMLDFGAAMAMSAAASQAG